MIRAARVVLGVAALGAVLGGCQTYGFDPVQRQVTAPSVLPPTFVGYEAAGGPAMTPGLMAVAGYSAQATPNGIARADQLSSTRYRAPAPGNAGQNTAPSPRPATQVASAAASAVAARPSTPTTSTSTATRARAAAPTLPPADPSEVSNSQLWHWRAEAARNDWQYDANKRPRRMPQPFQAVAWGNYLPLLTPRDDLMLTSDFGWRRLYGRVDFHGGVDIAGPARTAVFTPVDGEVILARGGNADDSGVVILAGERQYTFWHVTPSAGLRVGSRVASGQQVGTLTPWRSRTHLHFAVHLTGTQRQSSLRNDKNAVDPIASTWRAYQQGKNVFTPSASTAEEILNLAPAILAHMGFHTRGR